MGIKGTVSYGREANKTQTKGNPEKPIGPADYQLNWNQLDERRPQYSVPKDPFNNFIDKAVRDTLVDHRKKQELPGPGTYPMQNFNHDRTSRGTMHAQLRSISRTTMSGYL